MPHDKDVLLGILIAIVSLAFLLAGLGAVAWVVIDRLREMRERREGRTAGAAVRRAVRH
jgi:hypothetical protein